MREAMTLIFPGSGAQYIGMGRDLFDHYQVVRDTFEEASQVLNKNFTDICFKGGVVKQNKIENLLPSLYVASVASARVLSQEYEILPTLLAGHSLGEYSALTIAGAMEFSDGLEAVQLRSNLAKEVMLEEDAGMMIINAVQVSEVKKVCEEFKDLKNHAAIACINSQNQVLVSGHNKVLDIVAERLKGSGAHIIQMIGSAPYHSRLLEEKAKILRDKLMSMKIQNPRYTVLCGITGNPYLTSSEIVDNLTAQMYSPIKWSQVVTQIAQQSKVIIDVGPNDLLFNFFVKENSKYEIISLDKQEEKLNRVKNEWRVRDQLGYIKTCQRVLATTPNASNDTEFISKLVAINKALEQLINRIQMGDEMDKKEYEKVRSLMYRYLPIKIDCKVTLKHSLFQLGIYEEKLKNTLA